MARKSAQSAAAPVTRETATLIPTLSEVRDYDLDGGKQVQSYTIHKGPYGAKDRVLLGTVGRIFDATDAKSGKPVTIWTAKVQANRDLGIKAKTVQAGSRAAAIMLAIPGAYSAN